MGRRISAGTKRRRKPEIFDKEPATLDPAVGQGSFLADGGEKTVAMEPSEALLAEMGEAFESSSPTKPTAPAVAARALPRPNPRQTQMGLGRPADATPLPPTPLPTPLPAPSSFPSFHQPVSIPRKSGPLQVVHPEPAHVSFDLPRPGLPQPAFRQTLLGGAAASGLPVARSASPSQMGSPAYPTYQPPQPAQVLPGPGLGMSPFPGPAFPGAPVLPPTPYNASGVDMYPPAVVAPRPSRLRYYVFFVLFMIVGGGAAYMVMTRPGMLQIAVKPADARLAVAGALITSGPPYRLDKRPGIYRVAVSRPGYVTREIDVQISAGQTGHMDIELEPSPDTGFDLTSQPSGGLVWLDGQPLTVDERGKQATTNFHASRIAPGPHVIEIKGNPLYQPWRQEFLQEAGRTVRLHADLVPVPGGKPRVAPPATPTTPPPAVVTPPTETRPPPVARAERPRSGRTARAPDDGAEDIFETTPKAAASSRKRTTPRVSTSEEDIFESQGKAPGAAADCIATISSKPWAEVSIDGKPTGKITPLVNYAIPCGKHRLTFKNADLMIERNESVTLKPGQPFKKIFSLVEDEL